VTSDFPPPQPQPPVLRLVQKLFPDARREVGQQPFEQGGIAPQVLLQLLGGDRHRRMVRDRQQQPQVITAEGRTGPAIIHAHYAQRFSLPQQRGIHARGNVLLRDRQIRFAALPDKPLALLHGAARQRHADGWFAGRLMSFQQKVSCFWLFDEQRAPGRSRNDGHHLLHDGLKQHIQAPFLAQLQGKFV